MKKLILVLSVLLLLALVPAVTLAGPKNDACTTLKAGELTYSAGHYLAGQPLVVGYDEYGYNYQAHMFNGSYANVYLGRDGFPPYEGDDATYLAAYPSAETKWYWPYRNVQLIMKWNEPWLSNKDCDDDGLLDRYYGYAGYVGSGAWLTNHTNEGKGKDHTTSFVKIVAAPADAYTSGGYWYTVDDIEIGPVIWGSFAILQEVISGEGATYISPAAPGFGKYKP